jgi:tetratricopeptide (TPR) repeat protein
MVDPLSFIIIYAILTVASSISSNIASSGIFKILEPKIFKDKNSQEVKEALQDVIENLKEMGHENEWQELQERIEEITEKTIEIHQNIQDLSEIKDKILTALNENTDKTQENKEAIEELKKILLEYELPAPYVVLTKEELPGFEVALRPPMKVEPVKRSGLDESMRENQNVYVIGRPGIGKTLLLYQIAEKSEVNNVVWVKPHFSETDMSRLLRENFLGDILLVWDDIQNNASTFYRTVLKAKDQWGDCRIVCAARSTELEKTDEIPQTFWEDFKFLRMEVPFFNIEERKTLIGRCSEKIGVHIADDVTEKLAERSDGTPLYIISVFLNEKYREAGKILMGDVEALPEDVVDVWKEYFQGLERTEKAFLRCLMVLSKVGVRGVKSLVQKFYVFSGYPFSDFCDALETLKRSWVIETDNGYECHDVQLEAVPFRDEMLSYLKEFAQDEGIDAYIRLLLFFGISSYHYGEIARTETFSQRMFHVQEAVKFIEISIRMCRSLGLRAELSMSLNNASNFYAELYPLQQTRNEKLESIQTAVTYVEEAIEIRRDLGLRTELSGSLNNASNFYAEFSALQQTRNEKLESIQTAVTYVEEAMEIYRDLGLRTELSTSLNNASNRYAELYPLQETRDEKLESIQTAVKYIEEAIGIRKDLGLRADLSTSLNNASNRYAELYSLQQTRNEKLESIQTAVKYIEEAIGIYRDLGLRADLSGSLNNASNFYAELYSLQETRDEKLESIQTAVKYVEEAIEIRKDLGLRAELSGSLNNASNRYAELYPLQETRDEKLESIQTAVKYVEEAIEIRKDLGLRTELSGSLNNASNRYAELYPLQETRDEKLESIQTAVSYIEEAIEIYRDLGLRANLSMSLNNASNFYAKLYPLQETRDKKLESIQTAVKYIEEAIEIRRDLGLILNLADSLAISVFVYNSYLEFDSTVFSKAMTNCDQAIGIFLKFGLKGKYCPLLLQGIKYHQKMYTITKSPDHQDIITTYQQFLNQC